MRATLACATAFIAAFWIAGLTGGVTHARVGCITGYNPTALNIPASGATSASPASFSVLTATPTCRWDLDAGLLPIWLNLPTNFGGNGPGTVSFIGVLPNTALTPRSITLSYDGMPIVITQAGLACVVTMSPSPVLMPANGGTGSFTVNASGTSCSYTVQFPNDSFTLVSGGSGNTFPATVTFTLGPNTSSDVLNHSVLVSTTGTFGPGTQGVRVTQSGPPVTTDASNLGIGFAVHRSASAPTHVTGSEPVRITNAIDPTATWTASTTEPWLVVTPSTGVSPGTIEISIEPVAAGALARDNY